MPARLPTPDITSAIFDRLDQFLDAGKKWADGGFEAKTPLSTSCALDYLDCPACSCPRPLHPPQAIKAALHLAPLQHHLRAPRTKRRLSPAHQKPFVSGNPPEAHTSDEHSIVAAAKHYRSVPVDSLHAQHARLPESRSPAVAQTRCASHELRAQVKTSPLRQASTCFPRHFFSRPVVMCLSVVRSA